MSDLIRIDREPVILMIMSVCGSPLRLFCPFLDERPLVMEDWP